MLQALAALNKKKICNPFSRADSHTVHRMKNKLCSRRIFLNIKRYIEPYSRFKSPVFLLLPSTLVLCEYLKSHLLPHVILLPLMFQYVSYFTPMTPTTLNQESTLPQSPR